jgi:nitrite reductase/ring-hydroxylating ferredoxin subunit
MRVVMGLDAEVVEGGAKCATANQRRYALFRVGGKVYCLDNQCTHLGGPLCEGSLQGSIVQCPWHGSRFDVTSGNVVGPPARKPVRSYPVAIEAGKIVVDVP